MEFFYWFLAIIAFAVVFGPAVAMAVNGLPGGTQGGEQQ